MPDNVPALVAMYRENATAISDLSDRKTAAEREARDLSLALSRAQDTQKHLAALLHTLPGGPDALAASAEQANETRAKQRPSAPTRPEPFKSYPTTGSDSTSIPTASPVKPAEDKPARTKAPAS